MARRDADEVRRRIQQAVSTGEFRITQHAHEEMVDEDITLGEVIETMSTGVVLEDYPELVVVITAYEPKPPRWTTPERRGGSR